ncbi:MAG: response regulator [Cyanobacteria bacterium P01_A01_bin.114]
MHEPFELTSVIDRLADAHQTTRLHIVGPDVEWCLDVVGGQLLFAAHSLQYLTALETSLAGLGYEAALPAYWRLAQLGPYKRSLDEQGLDALSWTSKVVGALVQYKALHLEQAEKTLVRLSEDALESLLGLESATVTELPLPDGLWYATTTSGVNFLSLLHRLVERRQGWYPLCDRIVSPHQRPYCETPEHLYAPVPQGALPRQMLEALVRLMQGASIRQLAQVVKQDELKLAQLLYPYIQHRVIKLWPPVSPLDQLPWLSTKSLQLSSLSPPAPLTQNDSNSHSSNPHSSNPHSDSSLVRQPTPFSPTTFAQSKYLIVCIDDNQLVLQKIQTYLDPARFELKAILDPMASISKICAMKPDLILLDISMPRIDGHNLCRILRRSFMFKETPIVMISSNSSALNKAKAQSVGATDYLEKPFSQSKLMTVLDTYLAKTR